MGISLTNKLLCEEAKEFSQIESNHQESSLFGVTDGKAIGTYLEQKFQSYLAEKYEFEKGNSAKGIDFPELMVDIKVTSIKQPQSSCPFKSARQKIFGLGYSLLIFIYQKKDNNLNKTGQLNIIHTIYVDQSRTADYQTTSGIKKIIENDGNKDDLLAFFQERMLPVDDIEANLIAEELLEKSFNIGYLTISNALQWRLQYSRVIDKADEISCILRIK
ncbi:restriction endonuclease [Cyanobacterium sp. Dongsha4]|uniref:restriction endonuclease n=1 Tax=Cyanobacterium sp. DS4 TaxID=2878255 RepID=UPI002E7FB695|nr:restriction endonuclease [Cyanobacterium sp. Dongsha4]WVL01809.1 restriction endonuclease [Cyanobacterium sp. Dongsha4]